MRETKSWADLHASLKKEKTIGAYVCTYACTYTVPYSNPVFFRVSIIWVSLLSSSLLLALYIYLFSPSPPLPSSPLFLLSPLLHPSLHFCFLVFFPHPFPPIPLLPFLNLSLPFSSHPCHTLTLFSSPIPHLSSSPPLSSPTHLRANTRKVITAVTMGHDARTYIATQYRTVPYILLYCILY